MLTAIETALATTTQLLGKPHNILVMGRAAFMRVPVSEANDLNYLLCQTLARNEFAIQALVATIIVIHSGFG